MAVGPFTDARTLTAAQILSNVGGYSHTDNVAQSGDGSTQLTADKYNHAAQYLRDLRNMMTVVDVTAHGASTSATGAENLAAFELALAQAKSLKLPMFIPAGTFSVEFTSGNSSFALDWDGAEIMGAGRNVSIISTSSNTGSVNYNVFDVTHSCSVYIHDLQVLGSYVTAHGITGPTCATVNQATPGNTTSTPFEILIERCILKDQFFGVEVTTGPTNSQAKLRLKLVDVEINGGSVQLDLNTDPDWNGKSLYMDRCWLHDTDPNGSHLIYIHPLFSYNISNTLLGKTAATKYQLHNWGGDNFTLAPNFCLLSNVTFGDDTLGASWLTNEHAVASAANCNFLGPVAIHARSSLTIVGGTIRPNDAGGGSTSGITTYSDIQDQSHWSLSGVHFDLRDAGGNYAGLAISKPIKVTMTGCTVSCRPATQGPGDTVPDVSGVYLASISAGSAGCHVVIDGLVATMSSGVSSTSSLLLMTGACGRVELNGVRWVGSAATDRGVIRCDSVTACDGIYLNNCRIVTTRGDALYADATLPAGVFRGKDNDFGSSTIDFSSDQYLVLRQTVGSALTASATVDIDASYGVYPISGATTVNSLLIENDAKAHRAFIGTVITLLPSSTVTFSGSGNVPALVLDSGKAYQLVLASTTSWAWLTG